MNLKTGLLRETLCKNKPSSETGNFQDNLKMQLLRGTLEKTIGCEFENYPFAWDSLQKHVSNPVHLLDVNLKTWFLRGTLYQTTFESSLKTHFPLNRFSFCR